ncbi:endolytic transglycosylase MltG [Algirhabdus cladophorae]|uniref:endolytic transglycosylase MltG n=1 Tax=Algirhabdus cladophorae TaxID=3377108 RepID=UPI003B846AB8
MWRHVASNALTFFVVALFLLGGVILWGSKEYQAEGPLTQAICLQVKSGASFASVSRDLEGQGAVSNGRILRIGADYADKTRQLKAGSFLVPEQASMSEIVDIVTRGGASSCGTEVVYRIGVLRNDVLVRELDPATGRFVERAKFRPDEEEAPAIYADVLEGADTRLRVSVAEGATSWAVVEGLKSIDVLDGTVAEVPVEGALAPDSYAFVKGTPRAELLAQMQDKQAQILQAAWDSRSDRTPLQSAQEALILASIIEKETGIAEERGQVASVFVNRLNQGMKLQTDPTVIYGITKGEGSLGRGLRRSELRAATPYNTYVIDALPPTPIANPGRASIQAALNPEDTDYIFFVADGTGGHAFSVTLADHNANVAKWRAIEAARQNQ